ncbi:DUF4150 domain-containing protein [Enhygromyxa salina]|uniref:Uncharacterized protein n=1 Tax=Enhygromyxa salina TaxID=215803 RepID=A0A2S9YDK5_9BACT|nr:DUF4150 domain-containing protein [Enhygromyxa salina]PRQ03200.1 hypothetical protein ENSA7_53400 [Enhygromyxa salina]
MTKPVYANDRQILHAGDGLVHVSAPPDVCKTPSPGGPPMPVPYVNSAANRDLKKGSKRTKIGNKSIAIEGASLKTSTGDEPGSAGGGLMSSKTKGAMTWQTASPNVQVEGKAVVRFMDVTMHNGNTFNTAFQAHGGTGFAYADDFDGACPICKEGPERHRILEDPDIASRANDIIKDLRAEYANRNRHDSLRVAFKKGRGYMIAVMSCLCNNGKKTWAAASGPTTLDGFAAIAGRHVDNVISGGAATVETLGAANRSPKATAMDALDRRWKAINTLRKNPDFDSAGYSAPGNCAAAKLIAGAKGHVPARMTERFFSPQAEWSATYSVRSSRLSNEQLQALAPVELDAVMRNALAGDAEPVSFRAGPDQIQTVASCHTCQELLYMAVCQKDDLPCG